MNVILFVFGMGRSGSSALTRVLSLCGGTLPTKLLGASEGNPLGHWEPQGALDLNQALLAQHGASWFDPTLRLQDETAFSAEVRAAYVEKIAAFLRPFSGASVLLIKEPRITALSGFWFDAARRLGLSIRIAIPVRHPAEVAASLTARDGTSPELSNALWLKYSLLAEKESRPYPRVFVDYTSLLRNWRTEISRIASALTVSLSARDEASVDQFLRADLRRQRNCGEIHEAFGLPWISRTYAALCAAARDEPVDTTALDDIFASYRGCERGFRLALGDFQSRFTLEPRRDPNISRSIREAAGNDCQMLRAHLNSSWYREQNPDVIAAGCDPYAHWMSYGFNEGRLPCEDPLSLLDALTRVSA